MYDTVSDPVLDISDETIKLSMLMDDNQYTEYFNHLKSLTITT